MDSLASLHGPSLALNAGSSRAFDAISRSSYARTSREGDFASLLGKSSDVPGETPEAKARRAAEQFVSTALIQPILKQLRESSSAAPPFAPTQGEKQFQGLIDTELAQRMVRASNFPIVDRIAEQLSARIKPAQSLEVQT
jgi:Rod binding domain-containing protein